MQLGIISRGRARESSGQLHTTLPQYQLFYQHRWHPGHNCYACRGSSSGTNLADCDRVRPARWWPEPPSKPKNWPHLAMSCFIVRRDVHTCHHSRVLFFSTTCATLYRHLLFQFYGTSVKKHLPYLFSCSRDSGHSVGSSSASKFSLKVSMGLSSSLEPPGAPRVLVDTPILNLSLQSLLLTRGVSVPWNWKVPSPTRELL